MKKESTSRAGFFLVTICLVLLLSACSEKYPTGKDTALSVGNGRYQILHGITYSLFTLDNTTSTADDVREYYDDSKGKKLYLISKDSYIVVDYETDTCEQYPRIEDCKQEDQAIFQDESMFTAFGQP